MAKLLPASPTSNVLRVKLMDSTSTTGAGKTGLAYNTAGLIISTIRLNEASATTYTTTGSTIEDISTLGIFATPTATKCRFKEVDATNHPGVYEVQFDDTRFTSVGLIISISGATGMAQADFEIQCENISTNVIQIAGDTTSATNLKNQFDGTTGLTGVNYPARQDQMDNIVSTGAAINQIAESFTLTTGSQTGTYENTAARDGAYHLLQDTAGTLDAYYQFDIGSKGVPTSFLVFGHFNGTGDNFRFYGWNWTSSAWVQVGTINGVASTTNISNTFPLYSSMVGTGVNLGKARIRIEGTGLTSSSAYVDQLFLSYSVVNQSVGYANGQIWIDTVNGTAGTTPFINGVADKPCLLWADALTLSASTGIKQFKIIGGSSIQFTAGLVGYSLDGSKWTLDLNGQDISKTQIIGAEVSGIATAPTGKPVFDHCDFVNVTVPPSYGSYVAFEGTMTMGSAGDYIYSDCFSAIAGTARPTFVFFNGDCNFSLRRYSGGATLQGMTANCDCTFEGFGNVVLDASDTGGTLVIRGTTTLTVGGAATTIVDTARMAEDQNITNITGTATQVVNDVWNTLTSGMITVGSIGKKLADWVVGTIDTYTGNTKQTGDNYSRLGAPVGASISADIAAGNQIVLANDGRSYWVDYGTGNNANNGLTPETPFKDFSYALTMFPLTSTQNIGCINIVNSTGSHVGNFVIPDGVAVIGHDRPALIQASGASPAITLGTGCTVEGVTISPAASTTIALLIDARSNSIFKNNYVLTNNSSTITALLKVRSNTTIADNVFTASCVNAIIENVGSSVICVDNNNFSGASGDIIYLPTYIDAYIENNHFNSIAAGQYAINIKLDGGSSLMGNGYSGLGSLYIESGASSGMPNVIVNNEQWAKDTTVAKAAGTKGTDNIYDTLQSVYNIAILIQKYRKNKQIFKVEGGVAYLIVYDDDDVAELVRQPLTTYDGGNIASLTGTTTPSMRAKSSV